MGNIDTDSLGWKVLEKISISNIIGNYLEIFKKGNDYKCVCPFHDDSNPSMSISDSKRVFKCFSCNESGNAISFVMKYKGISFVEAIKEISKITNIDFGVTDEKIKKDNRYYLRKINKSACELYSALLITSEARHALKYLKELRNISDEMIEYFNIGYCPKEDYLSEYLAKFDYPLEKINESNLLTYYEGNKYNFFANRIIFPIIDIEGNVQGFSGRIIEDNKSKSKYMNSKESPVFKKNELLYNINNAKKYIVEKGEVFLLEGFMDVIALHKIGLRNCVAIMGTNISNFQIEQLSSLGAPIFNIFMDGDLPGYEATKKRKKSKSCI